MQSVKLYNGFLLPKVILGTFSMEDPTAVFENAWKAGYRAIDCAASYENEDKIGAVLSALGIEKEVQITSKVWTDKMGYDNTLKSFEQSERELGHIDMYLIHWPGKEEDNLGSWRALVRLYQEKRVQAIGVSNFEERHLAPLLRDFEIQPMVNQLELHLRNINLPLVRFCQNHNMAIEAWRPLMKGKALLEYPQLIEIAKAHEVTPAQAALRYLLQLGFVVLPKSTGYEHLKENIDIFGFSLTEEEMSVLAQINDGLRLTVYRTVD